MSVSVYIPGPFRSATGNMARIESKGANVEEVLKEVGRQYPAIKSLVFDVSGDVADHVAVFVNSRDIGTLQGKATEVHDGDEVSIVPAMSGGAVGWTEEQIQRYSRHIVMPQVGGKGQRKLLNAKVLLVGAGGLGSPTAMYLAAAGVGTLGIIDADVVDLSNLQRQLLHDTNDVGRPKVDSAAERIADLNPGVQVNKYLALLTSENALDIIKDYDIVINGCDNFPTRYLVNDASVFLNKPLVDGSILFFEGQATVFVPGQGCYRCLYPAPPPPGMVPSCAEGGVLGVLPGIVGCIQAIEAIKLILGLGETLAGRLLLFDALKMEFRLMKLRRDPQCPVCGDNPTVTELIDYEEFCMGISPAAAVAAALGH
ncbi:MAG TPA: molybdopterin-synthase adenylyltransferase MoeB [Dehalococcoidia bacterium]|nr:molybdopterin-synthase adenylyltransferase MoeB [Dehalococcoidia bacterium]